jgi:hypothetical protein
VKTELVNIPGKQTICYTTSAYDIRSKLNPSSVDDRSKPGEGTVHGVAARPKFWIPKVRERLRGFEESFRSMKEPMV